MSEFRSTLTSRVNRVCHHVRDQLLGHRNEQGHWTGELSNSALAAATAISALSQYRDHSRWPVLTRSRIDQMIDKASHWLLTQQNSDGGWGDTDHSHSNVATSMLVVAALELAGKSSQPDFARAVAAAKTCIDQFGGVPALRKRYGKDKTFAVPILANCAIAGQISWNEVAALPFEAVILPQKFYRFVNLPVVSYAIPALVAIGQLKFVKDPPWNPLTRLIRKISVSRGLKVLTEIQPGSGGFLEAIPLTCFVAMSLANCGHADHVVVQRCIQFTSDSFRDLGENGTWPIDTNLATWNTTLATNALDDLDGSSHLTSELLDWILSCQYTSVHPFTGAAAGGWGWSDLSGSVPDADDTSGALLAIRKWLDSGRCTREQETRILQAAHNGIQWLLDLQNRDKGWPTFCRGWGRLPFDRSGNDITAHVIRALVAWRDKVENPRISFAIKNGFDYLGKNDRPEGGWLPLWFGNQDLPGQGNPVYGTTKVLLAYLEAQQIGHPQAKKGVDWLLRNQNDDSGWGGGPSHERPAGVNCDTVTSSVQETALAVELFARLLLLAEYAGDEDIQTAFERGTEWLLNAIENDKTAEKWPIGFYFAKLWYYESLYPLVFSASALRTIRNAYTIENSPETTPLSIR